MGGLALVYKQVAILEMPLQYSNGSTTPFLLTGKLSDPLPIASIIEGKKEEESLLTSRRRTDFDRICPTID